MGFAGSFKRSADLSDCFDFNKQQAPFKPIPTKYPPRYFFENAGALKRN
ncbi:MAG: hypothetical protein WB810_06870 [Candidatus Cybelea sp.]